ncbi:MAG: GDP-mannose pyrophosphatase NudK [Chloroflexi bacterium]|nr:GDP-mannose pyrophosphatase NudK [Chloroflexota bacterium]
MNERIKIKEVELLSDNWYILKKTTFDYQRADGSWQTLTRETYDRGNGATILLYNRALKTVILTRQFRFPAYVNGHHGMMIEACAGLLDEDDAETCIKKETEEETGYRLHRVKKVFEAYMSPGSVTEKLFFFVAEYDPESKTTQGGGLASDGEDIGVLEIPFSQALEMINGGEIADGKTIMLLQYAKIHNILD